MSMSEDLFPRIQAPPDSTDSDTETDMEKDMESLAKLSQEISISTENMRQVLSDVADKKDIIEELETPRDRGFFRRLYGESVDAVTDFETYDRQTRLELALREKTRKLLNYSRDIQFHLGDLHSLDMYVSPYDTTVQKPQKSFFSRFQRQTDTNWEKQSLQESSTTDVLDEMVTTQPLEPRDKSHNTIQRKLNPRHVNSIAFGATYAIGIFLNSGKALSIAGPLGCLLGFIISGSIVVATMLSFSEMVTLIPVSDGISGICSRYISDPWGFAIGTCYWLSFALCVPAEIIAGTITLSYYPWLQIPTQSTAGWITLLLVLSLSINLLEVKYYGEYEYWGNWIKNLFILTMFIIFVVINRGGMGNDTLGFKYWDSSRAHDMLTFGLFRPTFDLTDDGTGALKGIGGAVGRFLSVITAVLISIYAFMGTEVPCVAAGEVINPRVNLPKSTRTVFWKITIMYMITVVLLGVNVYSGDPRLLRYWSGSSGLQGGVSQEQSRIMDALDSGRQQCTTTNFSWGGFANGNQSPWVVAVQSAGSCSLASVLNGFIVYFIASSGASQLYIGSRTLYALSIQGKAPKVFGRCNRYGTPWTAVLFTGAFGLLSYMGVNENSALVFQYLTNLVTAAALLAYAGVCYSFVRFQKGLKLRNDIISRNDKAYPYRSPFQPYLAIYGLVGCTLLILLMGFVVFLDGYWDTLVFCTSYGGLVLFLVLYAGFKLFKGGKVHSIERLDLDSGRREMDRVVWDFKTSFLERLPGWF